MLEITKYRIKDCTRTSTSTPSEFSQKRAARSLRMDRAFSTIMRSLKSHESGSVWYLFSRNSSSDSLSPDITSCREVIINERRFGGKQKYMLTVYPKNGGNIHVDINASESLFGMIPEKRHCPSLFRTCSRNEDGNEV